MEEFQEEVKTKYHKYLNSLVLVSTTSSTGEIRQLPKATSVTHEHKVPPTSEVSLTLLGKSNFL